MKALMSKFGKKQVALLAAFVVAGGAGGAFWLKSKKATDAHAPAPHSEASHSQEHAQEHVPAQAQHETSGHGLFGRISGAFESIQAKVDEIRRLDLENAKLKLENSQLKLKLESVQFDKGVAQSQAITEQYAKTLKGETGARVGRTLASIGYRAPTHLLPKQLYALGVTYLKAREFEKAAVIFTLLGDLPKDTQYKTPAHAVLTGTTWFKLNNYEMAEFYFDQALKHEEGETSESEEVLRYQAQARLWKAVIAHHRGKKSQAQFWMQELVDYHPQSPEARWINPGAAQSNGGHGERTPAEAHH